MLFLNAISEVYHHNDSMNAQRFKQSRSLMQKFVPCTPTTIMSMMRRGIDAIESSEMIRVSSCYTMFGDFDKAFGIFLKETSMHALTNKFGMRIKQKNAIVEPWPLRITMETTKEEFEIRCATSHTGCERYMELERI